MRKQISNGRHVLTAAGRLAVCPEVASCGGCSGTPPSQFQVVISGVTTGTCTSCSSVNGTHILDYTTEFGTADCYYQLSLGDLGGGCTNVVLQMAFGVTLDIIRVALFSLDSPASQDTWAITPAGIPADCAAVEDLEVPLESNAFAGCSIASATCTITAL